jgi:hypothetical protein
VLLFARSKHVLRLATAELRVRRIKPLLQITFAKDSTQVVEEGLLLAL